jgi:hypothetical protein
MSGKRDQPTRRTPRASIIGSVPTRHAKPDDFGPWLVSQRGTLDPELVLRAREPL